MILYRDPTGTALRGDWFGNGAEWEIEIAIKIAIG
jgi:hypothetical protein